MQTIAGASDASIRDVVPNAVPKLAARLGVQAVFCNGGTAARLYRKYLEPAMGPAAGTLPSTSPANAAWTLPRLTAAWARRWRRGWAQRRRRVWNDSKLFIKFCANWAFLPRFGIASRGGMLYNYGKFCPICPKRGSGQF